MTEPRIADPRRRPRLGRPRSPDRSRRPAASRCGPRRPPDARVGRLPARTARDRRPDAPRLRPRSRRSHARARRGRPASSPSGRTTTSRPATRRAGRRRRPGPRLPQAVRGRAGDDRPLAGGRRAAPHGMATDPAGGPDDDRRPRHARRDPGRALRRAPPPRSAALASPSAGLDAALIGVGPDLDYLTGYRAMPLERLTMLVVVAGAAPVLDRAAARGAGGPGRASARRLEITTWMETDDPHGLVAGLVERGRGGRAGRPPDRGLGPADRPITCSGSRRRCRAPTGSSATGVLREPADGQGRRRDRAPPPRRRGGRPGRRPDRLGPPRRPDRGRRRRRGPRPAPGRGPRAAPSSRSWPPAPTPRRRITRPRTG